MCLMLAKVLSAYTYPETQKTIYNGAQKYISLKPYYCELYNIHYTCLLYTSPSPRDILVSRMPSSA